MNSEEKPTTRLVIYGESLAPLYACMGRNYRTLTPAQSQRYADDDHQVWAPSA